MVRKKENEEKEAERRSRVAMSKYLGKIIEDIKASKKYYFKPIVQIIILFIVSLILLCIWEFLELPEYELTPEFVVGLSKIIMATTGTLVAFVAIFYVFRFRVFTENKRFCGLRKRICKEKLEEMGVKEDLERITKEKWEEIKEKLERKSEYKKIFEECNRRDFYYLKTNYDKIKANGIELGNRFTRSLIYAFSIIFFSYISIIFFEKINTQCSKCVIIGIFIAMNLTFVIFILLLLLDIPNILEGWIIKDYKR